MTAGLLAIDDQWTPLRSAVTNSFVCPDFILISTDLSFVYSCFRASKATSVQIHWRWWENRPEKDFEGILLLDLGPFEKNLHSHIKLNENCFNCLIFNSTLNVADLDIPNCHGIFSKNLGAKRILSDAIYSYNIHRQSKTTDKFDSK